jgi:putative tryptophan/tyrosine transport system substrate-binding protein
LRLALPDRRRVGVVLGPTSAGLANELRGSTRERDLALNLAEAVDSANVYSALQQVLPTSDALLALPDPVTFNATTVYGVMLTTYRAQVPVIGFSEGLVKAGALLGLYSTSAQVGRQGAEIASRTLAGESGLPAPQYPRYFTVRVNGTVARSLGIPIAEEAVLTAALAGHGVGRREASRPNSAVDAAIPWRTP